MNPDGEFNGDRDFFCDAGVGAARGLSVGDYEGLKSNVGLAVRHLSSL